MRMRGTGILDYLKDDGIIPHFPVNTGTQGLSQFAAYLEEIWFMVDKYKKIKVLVVEDGYVLVDNEGVPLMIKAFVNNLVDHMGTRHGQRVCLYFDPSSPKYQDCLSRNKEIVESEGHVYNNIGLEFVASEDLDPNWLRELLDYMYNNYIVSPVDWGGHKRVLIHTEVGLEYEPPIFLKRFREKYPTINATYAWKHIALYDDNVEYGYNVIVL